MQALLPTTCPQGRNSRDQQFTGAPGLQQFAQIFQFAKNLRQGSARVCVRTVWGSSSYRHSRFRRTGRDSSNRFRSGLIGAWPGDRLYPAVAQKLLHAFDCVTVGIEKLADTAQQIDVFGPVVSPTAAALQRLDVGELAFPESEDVWRHIEIGRDFADRPKSCRRFALTPAVLGRPVRIGHLLVTGSEGRRAAAESRRLTGFALR